MRYARDGRGLRSEMRDAQGTTTYAYDALGRLVAVTDRSKQATTYRYDPVGNRTATLRSGKVQEQASFDAADQLSALLRADGSLESALSYDANGSLIQRSLGDALSTYGIWAGEELRADPDFFRPLHTEHLVERCSAVLPYLALPPGWRFLIAPGHEDVWYDPSLLEIGRPNAGDR